MEFKLWKTPTVFYRSNCNKEHLHFYLYLYISNSFELGENTVMEINIKYHCPQKVKTKEKKYKSKENYALVLWL